METTIGIKRVEANAWNSHDGLQQLVRRKLKVKLELGAKSNAINRAHNFLYNQQPTDNNVLCIL